MALDFPVPGTQTPVNTWSPTSTPSASTNGLTYIWDGQKWGTIGSSPADVTWNEITGKPDFDALYVETAGDEMSGNLTVPSLNGGPFATNQLINGQLVVWQRSSPVVLPGNGYGPDRWAKVGGSQITFTRIPRSFGQIGGCEVSGAAIQTSKILQPIEIGWGGATGAFTGQWTLSWYSDSQPTSASAEFAVDSGSTNAVAWTPDGAGIQSLGSNRYSLTFTATTPAANSEVVNIIFVPPTAATWTFSGVQFEPGPVPTPIEQRPIGMELSLCQRYYQTFANGPTFTKRNDDSASGLRALSFMRSVTMRTAPSETGAVNSGGNLAFTDSNATIMNATCDASGVDQTAKLVNYTADAEL